MTTPVACAYLLSRKVLRSKNWLQLGSRLLIIRNCTHFGYWNHIFEAVIDAGYINDRTRDVQAKADHR